MKITGMNLRQVREAHVFKTMQFVLKTIGSRPGIIISCKRSGNLSTRFFNESYKILRSIVVSNTTKCRCFLKIQIYYLAPLARKHGCTKTLNSGNPRFLFFFKHLQCITIFKEYFNDRKLFVFNAICRFRNLVRQLNLL